MFSFAYNFSKLLTAWAEIGCVESLLQVGYHMHFLKNYSQNDSATSKNRIRTNNFLYVYVCFGSLYCSGDFKLEPKIWQTEWCLACATLDKTAKQYSFEKFYLPVLRKALVLKS